MKLRDQTALEVPQVSHFPIAVHCSGSTLVYHHCLQYGPLIVSRHSKLGAASEDKIPIDFTCIATDNFGGIDVPQG